MLTQRYLERSQGPHTKITMLLSAYIQLWKTYKLYLKSYISKQNMTVQSARYESKSGWDASHYQYESLHPSTCFRRIKFYFSFDVQMLTLIRPFKVQRISHFYQVTGITAFEVIHIYQIRALVGLINDMSEQKEYLIERDSAILFWLEYFHGKVSLCYIRSRISIYMYIHCSYFATLCAQALFYLSLYYEAVLYLTAKILSCITASLIKPHTGITVVARSFVTSSVHKIR